MRRAASSKQREELPAANPAWPALRLLPWSLRVLLVSAEEGGDGWESPCSVGKGRKASCCRPLSEMEVARSPDPKDVTSGLFTFQAAKSLYKMCFFPCVEQPFVSAQTL